MKQTILQEPHPMLREVARPAEFGDPHLLLVTQDLYDTLGKDLGLAAPQIGAPLRVIIARIPGITLCVNPSWEKAGAKRPGEEKCLSVVGGGAFRIFRHIAIEATWSTLDGSKRTARLVGRDAIVFQHECDHLDGITINRKWAK